MGCPGVSRPAVSVVTLTRDRWEPLRRCAESLIRQSLPPREWVVLDNGPLDEHQQLQERLRELFDESAIDCRVFHSEPVGFAALRQRAFQRASGDLWVSLDDDCVAAEDAVECIVRRFEEDERLGLLGGNLDNIGFTGAERFKGRGRLATNCRYETVEDGSQAEVFGSANQSIRRTAFESSAGYDPFFTDGLEEADLVLSIRAQGWGIAYAPEVRIEHHHCQNRHRGPGRNLNSMRLYLLFKHRSPKGLRGWTRFLVNEIALLFGDLRRHIAGVPTRIGSLGRSRVSRWPVALGAAAREAIKAAVARLRIPELFLRARSARR